VVCRALTLDVLSGKATRTYQCGIQEGDALETACSQLKSIFSYFSSMRTVESKLRYFDFLGAVYQALGKTGGRQGDPLEMIIFCLSIHHLWGRTMQSYTENRAIAYADDGSINAPLSVALRILADLKQVFKDDAGLELNMLPCRSEGSQK
jgi:hypothetical protein